MCTVRPSSAANTRPTDTAAPVELSPFEVRAEDDAGYQAANTTSGSRLNSRLKDTPASVSAFTPEFLADIAATWPGADLQHLRQLRRNAIKEAQQSKPPRAYRELFRVLRQVSEDADVSLDLADDTLSPEDASK